MTVLTGNTHTRLSQTWLALLGLTGASVVVLRIAHSAAGLELILLFAVLKACLVVLNFMDLGEYLAMRRALIGWCMILALVGAAKTILAVAAAG
ncbi:MAG: hypothetical protein E5X74_14485 [Mesorhizobium sp.]|nr:MAG: hypothetical protein EOR74_09535 [Mesorhizobium sp.]RWM39482.1 MAG: hypothetical protein EOR75_13435 [Mesorhizobium sp.]TIO76945.1 MAG: hypothetical protein E5X75_12370 [Mesorhizobium sp.]TIO84755.1 MAG: hypothetical protein E5X74_14485 [Mesorhizobium sp.]TJV52536.1 MAG: hypothetical protein E5Y01_09255 [Mesorhizobium sp.]